MQLFLHVLPPSTFRLHYLKSTPPAHCLPWPVTPGRPRWTPALPQPPLFLFSHAHSCFYSYFCLLTSDFSLLSSHLRYRLNVFLLPLPKVGCPKILEIWNPRGKVEERSGLRFEHSPTHSLLYIDLRQDIRLKVHDTTAGIWPDISHEGTVLHYIVYCPAIVLGAG